MSHFKLEPALFFTRGKTDKGNTKEVWVYDLRANMPAFGKRTALKREHFAAFEMAYGDDPWGSRASLTTRLDEGEEGRWRRFTRAEIISRGDNLDISWLKDESVEASSGSCDPTDLVRAAMSQLESALEDLTQILAELGQAGEEEAVE